MLATTSCGASTVDCTYSTSQKTHVLHLRGSNGHAGAYATERDVSTQQHRQDTVCKMVARHHSVYVRIEVQMTCIGGYNTRTADERNTELKKKKRRRETVR